MSETMVALCYSLALVTAIFLLWRYSHTRWYWHILAVIGALAVGLMPPLVPEASALYDLIIGITFLFLLVWGIGEFAVKALHLHRHV